MSQKSPTKSMSQKSPTENMSQKSPTDMSYFFLHLSLSYICGILRSWGHLSFNYYLVKTDPILHIFGSKKISLTFIDILNANLSEIEKL